MKRTIFFFAQFPPPVHGASSVNQFIFEALKTDPAFEIIRFSFVKTSENRIIFYLQRIARCFWSVFIILKNLRTARSSVLYMPVSGGFGIVFEMIPWLFGACIFKKRIMHHHSFQYCYQRGTLMNMVQAFRSQNIHNIFLCNRHQELFTEMYTTSKNQASIISNEFLLKQDYEQKEQRQTGSRREFITVGHLSNLSAEKGFNVFCSLVRQLGLHKNIRFELAGPTADAAIADKIKRLEAAYPETFVYRGALYRQQKSEWYRALDFFIFPSAYANEAYPLVVSEAIFQNVIPLTTPIGCLSECNRADFTFSSREFEEKACGILQRAVRDEHYLKELQDSLHSMRQRARAKSKTGLDTLTGLFRQTPPVS